MMNKGPLTGLAIGLPIIGVAAGIWLAPVIGGSPTIFQPLYVIPPSSLDPTFADGCDMKNCKYEVYVSVDATARSCHASAPSQINLKHQAGALKIKFVLQGVKQNAPLPPQASDKIDVSSLDLEFAKRQGVVAFVNPQFKNNFKCGNADELAGTECGHDSNKQKYVVRHKNNGGGIASADTYVPIVLYKGPGMTDPVMCSASDPKIVSD